MNKTILIAVAGVLGMAAAPGAMADRGGYAWARVTDVRPIVRMVTVNAPRRECWAEEVVVVQERSDPGAQLVGALIGGLIGNQIGSGDGRRAATAAGALIGAQVGHNRTKVATPVTTVQQRCEMHAGYRQREVIDGYDVEYHYRGRTYRTRMAEHPGERIRVRVAVRPARWR